MVHFRTIKPPEKDGGDEQLDQACEEASDG